MSGTRSALDTLSADETALMESMRDETDAPEIVETEPVEQTPAPDEDLVEDEPETEGAEKPRNRVVPHAQFHAANEKRKAAEAARVAAEQALAVQKGVVEERMRILTEAVQASLPKAAPAAPEIAIPDVETDPVGHVKALLAQEQTKRENLEAIVRGFQEGQQQNAAVQELRSWGLAQEAAFKATEPSFDEAMAFLANSRIAQMAKIGIKDPAEQQRILSNDITNIAMKTHQDQATDPSANFAERLYGLAETFGYKKAAPAEAAPGLPALDAALPDRAARIEAGRRNSTTIAGAGSAAPQRLTPERIAALPQAQFDAYVAKIKNDPAAMRELFGD